MASNIDGLFLAYATYVVAAGSPGPSNMRIMATAMTRGRRPVLVLTAGVLAGSVFWGLMAATGISALLAQWAGAMTVLKYVCGVYLIYLGIKAGRAAARPDAEAGGASVGGSATTSARLFRQGLVMHLTNPKAVLGWIALMALGLDPHASWRTVVAILLGCAALGTIIFTGYAILFSSAPMVRAYGRSRRWIDGTLSAFFTLAGVQLLTSRA
jgi:threonine efflux protein